MASVAQASLWCPTSTRACSPHLPRTPAMRSKLWFALSSGHYTGLLRLERERVSTFCFPPCPQTSPAPAILPSGRATTTHPADGARSPVVSDSLLLLSPCISHLSASSLQTVTPPLPSTNLTLGQCFQTGVQLLSCPLPTCSLSCQVLSHPPFPSPSFETPLGHKQEFWKFVGLVLVGV